MMLGERLGLWSSLLFLLTELFSVYMYNFFVLPCSDLFCPFHLFTCSFMLIAQLLNLGW